ncbi:hypothetical protein [Streptomyces tritici]|uniref:hypothetical protein n=1 Tax=Streptomyces tritici TaxID=2054410 RepID=UPI003AF11206
MTDQERSRRRPRRSTGAARGRADERPRGASDGDAANGPDAANRAPSGETPHGAPSGEPTHEAPSGDAGGHGAKHQRPGTGREEQTRPHPPRRRPDDD